MNKLLTMAYRIYFESKTKIEEQNNHALDGSDPLSKCKAMEKEAILFTKRDLAEKFIVAITEDLSNG